MISLEEEEKVARSKSHINEIEQKWEKIVQEASSENLPEILKRYNCFRLRNLLILKKKRPGILLGFINDHHFPNFHTIELLKSADIVSLTSSKDDEDREVHRIFYKPANDNFLSIRKKFPKGFKPKLFLDMQAAHGHMHPIGLSQMPFPTVACICHHQHGPAVKTICELFDFVIPVGSFFSPSCNYQKAKVLNFPFGFNWASFDRLFRNPLEWKLRKIDVSVTFSESNSPYYKDLRNEVIQIMKDFQRKWEGKYVVKIAESLEKKDFVELLQNSKISINVVAVNGPYNYRSCEIVNAGALLFQTNVTESGLTLSFDEILEPEKDFVYYDSTNLQNQLLQFLEKPEVACGIAKSAYNRMKNDFSYGMIFSKLIKAIENQNLSKNPEKANETRDKFLLGKFLWQQHQQKDLQLLGSAFLWQTLSEEKDTIRCFSNLLAILPELIQALGFNSLKTDVAKHSKELAESLDPQNLKQIAVQLISIKMDHIVVWYNFLSLSIEFKWSPNAVLQDIANQALINNSWGGYSEQWLLRTPSSLGDEQKETFTDLRYKHFFLPLMGAETYKEEWEVYINYLVKILK